MVRLEKVVEDLFAKNPNLSDKEAVEKLKTERDQKTGRPRWHASTIRNRVETYKKKQKEIKTVDVKTEIDIEGKDIGKKVDPFRVETKGGSVENDVIVPTLPKEVQDGFVKDVKEFVKLSEENKKFKEDLISVVTGMKTDVETMVASVKREMSSVSKNIAEYVPVDEYDEIELKISTINNIKESTADGEYKDESDYIDSLIKGGGTSDEVATETYKALIELAKGRRKGFLLRLFYDDISNQLTYMKIRNGKFGINIKNLVLGIGIGAIVGIAIMLVIDFLTATPPPIP